MNIKYYLFNPTGNITPLVETPVPVEIQPAVAAQLMKLEPTAEQVGFIGESRLRLAGGEFCGNAAMSAAMFVCLNDGIKSGESRKISLSVSGAENKVNVSVTAQRDSSCECTVNMPKPLSVGELTLNYNGSPYTFGAVDFGGIVHLIAGNTVMDKTDAENAAKKWCAELDADAIGIMFYDSEKSALTPLVHVRNAQTLFWEKSCASGTAAVGAYVFNREKKPVSLTLDEPGGKLSVYADGEEIKLTGSVKLMKKASVNIENIE